jgi:hypothetical protein
MKTVFGRVLQKNNVQYFDTVKNEHVNCGPGTLTEGLVWFVPVIVKGRLKNYRPVIQTAKPTADSVRAVRVKDTETGNTYYLALGDAALDTDFSTICNACCSATSNNLPAVTVPNPLLEEYGCTNATTGNYEYVYVAPSLVAGEVYRAEGSLEGVAFTGALAGGHASVAAFVTWANTNWSAYGTWSAVGQTLKLTNATKKYGYIRLNRGV